MRKIPEITMKDVRRLLRNNFGRRYRGEIVEAFIVGSVAKGTHHDNSDLDIALVIPAIKGKTALKYTEEFHNAYRNNSCYPNFSGWKVDFQFFYASDLELNNYSKIKIS
ncbi:MAG TPA: nucleotidyltransferase domain-containing protein [Leptospiraceae bacterium]|nr:nucleotidyltransferase domain-containing protein [Leptospiraceae bacterium]